MSEEDAVATMEPNGTICNRTLPLPNLYDNVTIFDRNLSNLFGDGRVGLKERKYIPVFTRA